ncbi:glycosyltransferase [Marinigracilibium pacificum]|nr:glycosyltransferase [Marinigracilibium pacificum]
MIYLIFCFLTILYSLYLLSSLKYIVVRESDPEVKSLHKVYVVVPFRNEEQKLPALLKSIDRLAFNEFDFNIILVNDHSEDQSLQICEDWINSTDNKSILLSLSDTFGKKAAIRKAIELADSDALILTTDADCTFGEYWIDAMLKAFCEDPKTALLVGPVWIRSKSGILRLFQTYEFAALQGVTMSTIGGGQPIMCNAANLMFRRKDYFQAIDDGMNMDQVSGDDIFLLQSILKLHGAESIKYCHDRKAVVQTDPVDNWTDLYHQRIRWSGKWKAGSQPVNIKLSGGLIFMMYVFLLISIILLVSNFVFYKSLIVLLPIMLKTICELVFLRKVFSFFGKSFHVNRVFLLAVIYPLYSVFFGTLSLFRGFEWKDRKADHSGIWGIEKPGSQI